MCDYKFVCYGCDRKCNAIFFDFVVVKFACIKSINQQNSSRKYQSHLTHFIDRKYKKND